MATDGDLSRRIADILVCNVSTRKYARVVHRCADELGISKSAVSLSALTWQDCWHSPPMRTGTLRPLQRLKGLRNLDVALRISFVWGYV